MTLTDTQRFWKECRDAGAAGLHSWDCYGWTRNAPQRAKDCVDKGEQIYVRQERRNGRPGARYWLEGFQPDDATPVRGNRAPVDVTPAPADTKEHVAVVRDDDHFTEVPLADAVPEAASAPSEPLAWFRDYTDPEGSWLRLPLSEVMAA